MFPAPSRRNASLNNVTIIEPFIEALTGIPREDWEDEAHEDMQHATIGSLPSVAAVKAKADELLLATRDRQKEYTEKESSHGLQLLYEQLEGSRHSGWADSIAAAPMSTLAKSLKLILQRRVSTLVSASYILR